MLVAVRGHGLVDGIATSDRIRKDGGAVERAVVTVTGVDLHAVGSRSRPHLPTSARHEIAAGIDRVHVKGAVFEHHRRLDVDIPAGVFAFDRHVDRFGRFVAVRRLRNDRLVGAVRNIREGNDAVEIVVTSVADAIDLNTTAEDGVTIEIDKEEAEREGFVDLGGRFLGRNLGRFGRRFFGRLLDGATTDENRDRCVAARELDALVRSRINAVRRADFGQIVIAGFDTGRELNLGEPVVSVAGVTRLTKQGVAIFDRETRTRNRVAGIVLFEDLQRRGYARFDVLDDPGGVNHRQDVARLREIDEACIDLRAVGKDVDIRAALRRNRDLLITVRIRKNLVGAAEIVACREPGEEGASRDFAVVFIE